MSEHIVHVKDLACGYEGHTVFEHLDLTLRSRQVVCLLGPNGVGKTTLFKTLLGFQKPLSGSVLYDGEDTATWSRRRFGQVFGYIPQLHTPTFPFSVLEIVLMGRTPYLNALGSVSADDERIARAALDELGMAEFVDRDYTMLSGGERQMVLVARVLAQQPDFLVMDEPTSALDMGNQVRVLEVVASLAEKGYGILMTTHDPNQALLLGGEVICLQRDGGFFAGTASEVLDEQTLSRLYGCDIRIDSFEANGAQVSTCVPILERKGDAQ